MKQIKRSQRSNHNHLWAIDTDSFVDIKLSIHIQSVGCGSFLFLQTDALCFIYTQEFSGAPLVCLCESNLPVCLYFYFITLLQEGLLAWLLASASATGKTSAGSHSLLSPGHIMSPLYGKKELTRIIYNGRPAHVHFTCKVTLTFKPDLQHGIYLLIMQLWFYLQL